MSNTIITFINKIKDYFTLEPYLVTQAEAEASIREGVSFRGTNILILILAIFIASLGLNTNSTAVIIGAMLISPLMGPIIGLGLGVGIQDFPLLKQSLRNLLMATLFSIATSTLYFLISPVGQSHSELLARTSPTIYDVLIGFFGGAAGIVAIGSKSKGNVIPGVAIATALMPPLCTVGYGLATWQPHYFLGALYLFLINSIFICLATFIGVKLMKYKPAPSNNTVRAKKIRRMVYIVAVITLLPSVYLTFQMLRQSRYTLNAEKFIKEQCVFPHTQVLTSKINWTPRQPQLSITLIGQPLPVDSLTLALSSHLSAYGMQGTEIKIIQGGSVSHVNAESVMSTGLGDIYKITQSELAARQTTIDSLRNIIAIDNTITGSALAVMPELKVIFPQISELAVSRTMLATADSLHADTLNVALVRLTSPLTPARRTELSRYLEARLGLSPIRVINL